MNQNNIEKFTNALYELVCKKELSLQQSLEIISNINDCDGNKKVQKAASEILRFLQNGESLSAGLENCKSIKFDPMYISFFGLSELTGNLTSSVEFIKKRLDEKNQVFYELLQASIYPCLVFILSIILTSVYFFYGQNLFMTQENLFTQKQIISVAKYLLLWFCVSFFCFRFIYNQVKENRNYIAFLITGFLLSSGMSMNNAFNYSVLFLGNKSKEGKLFIQARDRVSLGMDLLSAFKSEKHKIPGLETAIYYALKGGKKENVFEKIAVSIRETDMKKKKLCMSLIEPLLIVCTGVYLIIIISSFILPVITNTGINF